MELVWSKLPGEFMIYSGLSQTEVEGTLPLPEGHDSAELLSYTGEVIAVKAIAGENTVAVEGCVAVDLICRDEDTFAFCSKAAFHYNIPAQGVTAGMKARAQLSLQSLEITGQGDKFSLCAVVDISAVATAEGEKALSGINGVNTEADVREISLNTQTTEGSGSFQIRDELDVPFASAIIYSTACAAVREVYPTDKGAAIEGSVYISALVESKTGALNQLNRNIPFTQNVECKGGSPLWAEVIPTGWELRASEEFGVVVAEVQLVYTVYGRKTDSADIISDIFSPAQPFECTHGIIRPYSYMGRLDHRHTLSETIAVPDGMPEAQRVIYCAARPLITGKGIENGRLTVEGLLFLRVIYAGESGSIFSFGEDIPFSMEADASGATEAEVSCFASGTVSGSGKRLELSCTLLLSASLWCTDTMQAVTGIEECGCPDAPRGIIAFFPEAGDTLYSIAKRYNTGRENIRMMQPSLPEVMEGNERIVFIN